LVVLDVSGNPNWQGNIEVRDASGNWVDTFKHGWISELGKVDFKLAAGTYTLNIQPGQYATGIRTTTTITVPATGNFTATISLVDGNVQGTALKTGSPSLPCGLVVATAVGKLVAEKALKAGIDTVTFDRGGYLYHGRIKSLAEGARAAGLKF
jgi:hypothetical protein